VVKLRGESPAGEGPTLRISEDADEIILGRPSLDRRVSQAKVESDKSAPEAVINPQIDVLRVSESSNSAHPVGVAKVRENALLQLEGSLPDAVQLLCVHRSY
jgi:hypothetical protein